MFAPDLEPGETIVHDQHMVMSHAGISNLSYEGNRRSWMARP